MNREDFEGLLESVREVGEIRRGLCAPARERTLAARRKAPAKPFWGICIETDDPAALVPRKVYLVRPAGPRVVVTDEAGEATSCPMAWFLPVSVSQEDAELLAAA